MDIEKLEDFINSNKQEINSKLKDLSKDELIEFAEKHSIPYKKYFSRNKLLNEIVEFINTTMVYIRIAR